MNGPGGYEWLRGEGGHEVLFIDERSDAAPQCYWKGMWIETTGCNLTF